MTYFATARQMSAIAIFAIVGGAFAAEAPAAKDTPRTSAADARKLASELSSKRDKMIADHDALVKEFKAASEAQRKEIIAKMAELKKNFEETMSALRKQMSEDERKRRQNAAPARK